MRPGTKTSRVLTLHAEGLSNSEIARLVPCSEALVTNTLRAKGLVRNEPMEKIPERIAIYGSAARTYASRLMETGSPALQEAALCLAEAACEIERAHALLLAHEDKLYD